jgi:hypothetical protein
MDENPEINRVQPEPLSALWLMDSRLTEHINDVGGGHLEMIPDYDTGSKIFGPAFVRLLIPSILWCPGMCVAL